MLKFLYGILLMSVSGSLMYLLSSLINKPLRRSLARWYYAMLAASVMMLVIPLHLVTESHKLITVSMPHSIVTSNGSVTVSGGDGVPAAGVDLSLVLFAVWAIPAAVLAIRSVIGYVKTARALGAISEECHRSEMIDAYFDMAHRLGIRRGAELRLSAGITSPMLFGIIRPKIILPDRNFSRRELDMILAHELTHYKHKDLVIKLLAGVALCIHWFNPGVWFLPKSIDEGCELCCDESVLDTLNLSDKKDYGRLILSVMDSSAPSRMFTTAMASPKSQIKRRLRKIVDFRRPSRLLRIAAVMTALSLALCSLTALGFETVTERLPDSVKRAIEKTVSLTSSDAPFSDAVESVPTETEVPTDVETTPTPAPTAAPETEMTAQPTMETYTFLSDAAEETESEDVTSEDAASEGAAAVTESATPKQSESEETTPEGVLSDAEPTAETESAAANETYATQTEDIPERTQPTGAYKVVALPSSSYQFNPDFSDGNNEVQSDILYAERAMTVSFERTGGISDCMLKVYRTSGEGDELIYDETALENMSGYNLKIRFYEGESYYAVAVRTESSRAGVFIRGR